MYTPDPNTAEPANTQAIISALNLQKHVEGGYYAEIDRNPLTIPNPFLLKNGGDEEEDVKNTADKPMSGEPQLTQSEPASTCQAGGGNSYTILMLNIEC